jgi:YVTN family beta-propeller protein
MKHYCTGALFFSWLCAVFVASDLSAVELSTRLRRPIALVESADGKFLYVANRDSGSISVVDLAARQVVAEHAIGRRLADLAPVPGTSRFLAADEAAHELIVLDADGSQLKVLQRLRVSPYPVSILIQCDGKQATVASLWSQRLTFVSFDGAGSWGTATTVDLAFAPRCQVRLPGSQLLVADSFGGNLAVIEPSTHGIAAQIKLPAHNVRGLGVSPSGEMLIVAHQMLNDLAQSIRNDIHWGLLMSNDLRWLRIDSLLDSVASRSVVDARGQTATSDEPGRQRLYHGAHMHPLGDAGRGGGDPGSLDVAADGTVVVAISGVNEVAFGKENDFSMQRLAVPARPTAVRLARSGRQAFVACTLDDSVSILDLDEKRIVSTISLGPKPRLSVAQQGELLFYDARLSHDGWMSCHSCHTDGHANGQMNDNFSDRSFGAAKRVLSLLGVRDTLPLAWNGQVPTLEKQIENSVNGTMQREEPPAKAQVEAIAAFVRTLDVPPPVGELRGVQDRAAIERGRLIFERRECATCHAPPTYTSPATYDVSLGDSQGNREFNPPSLRGISHRQAFFHDNRAATLAEVLALFGHPGDAAYSPAELSDLVAFLMSL